VHPKVLISVIADAEPLIGDATPEVDRSDDMHRIFLQDEAILEVDVGIGEVDCQQGVVVAQVRPKQ
jgi:hypothetical protein